MRALDDSLNLMEFRVVTGGPFAIAVRLEIEAEGTREGVEFVWRCQTMARAQHEIRSDQRARATGHVERRGIDLRVQFEHYKDADAAPHSRTDIAWTSARHIFPVRSGPAEPACFVKGLHIGRREQKDVRIRLVVVIRGASDI